MQTSINGSSPHDDTIQTLRQSLEKTLDQNRLLFSEIARFTKTESLRIAQLNLDHAHHAFARLEDRRDLAGLIGAQQEWIKEMMQEYAAQSLRYAEMFRGLAGHARDQAEHAAAEFEAEAEAHRDDLARAGEAVLHAASRAAE